MSWNFFSGLEVDNFRNYTPPLQLPCWFYSLTGLMVLSFHSCYNLGTCQQTRCVASPGSVHLHNCDIFFLIMKTRGQADEFSPSSIPTSRRHPPVVALPYRDDIYHCCCLDLLCCQQAKSWNTHTHTHWPTFAASALCSWRADCVLGATSSPRVGDITVNMLFVSSAFILGKALSVVV